MGEIHGFKFKIKLWYLVIEYIVAYKRKKLKPWEFSIIFKTPYSKKRSFVNLFWMKKDGCFMGDGKWVLKVPRI